MSRGSKAAIEAAKRLLVDATNFTENERAERNVESAIELLEAAVEPAERDAEQGVDSGTVVAED